MYSSQNLTGGLLFISYTSVTDQEVFIWWLVLVREFLYGYLINHSVLVFLGSKNSVMVGHLKTKSSLPLRANNLAPMENCSLRLHWWRSSIQQKMFTSCVVFLFFNICVKTFFSFRDFFSSRQFSSKFFLVTFPEIFLVACFVTLKLLALLGYKFCEIKILAWLEIF